MNKEVPQSTQLIALEVVTNNVYILPFLRSQPCLLQVRPQDLGPTHMNGVQFHKRQSPLVCQTGHSLLVLYSESMPAGVHRLQIPAENSHTKSDGSISRKEFPVTSISNLSN